MRVKGGGHTAVQRLKRFRDARISHDTSLRDFAPRFLNALVRALEEESPSSVDWDEFRSIFRENNGPPAAGKDSSLSQTLRELGGLRAMVLGALEGEATLTPAEREIVLRAFEEGMIGAAAGYEQRTREGLQDSEAHTHDGLIVDSFQEHQPTDQFRLLADSMPQIVWIADAEGALVYINQRFFEYTGIPEEHGLGQAWRTTIHPGDFPRLDLIWYESMTTGKPYFSEYRLMNSEGEYRWHRGQAIPVRDQHGAIIKWYGNSTDVHDYHVAHDLLIEERDLRERFVATMTHDLRTPLSAARMNTQLLVRRLQEPEHARKLGSRVMSNIDRADRMIQGMLDASRIRAGEKLPIEFRWCSIREVIQSAILDLSSVHGDRFVLRAEEPFEGDWGCDAIQRILENLCSNAVKYGAAGSPVTVTLGRKDQERLLISVHNLGPVIPLEDQKSLFEQFHRSSSALAGRQKGWGLGLTIVRGLAEAHDGSVSLESVEGAGTTFTVELPLKPISGSRLPSSPA